MNIIAETPRLYLRPMAVEDAPDFFLLNSDPEVMRYTGDKPFANVEEARQLVINYPYYKKYGYGRYTLIEKQSGEFIGWCGIRHFEELGETDVGYRLLRKHWNKGYATEAGLASLDLGFNAFGLKRIIGRAHVDNAASIRVLQKLGLTFEKYYEEDGELNVLYAIEK